MGTIVKVFTAETDDIVITRVFPDSITCEDAEALVRAYMRAEGLKGTGTIRQSYSVDYSNYVHPKPILFGRTDRSANVVHIAREDGATGLCGMLLSIFHESDVKYTETCEACRRSFAKKRTRST